MGFTIDDALREFKKNYKMTLLAGEDGCSNAHDLGTKGRR